MLAHIRRPSCDSFPAMFMVTPEEAAIIQQVYSERGEWPAVAELRRYAPGIADYAEALRCVRIIVGWRSQAPQEDRMEHRLTGYHRSTDGMAVSYPIPRTSVWRAAAIANVPATDPEAIGSYPLDQAQADELAWLIGATLDHAQHEHFMEPLAAGDVGLG
ncbi:DUF7683 domain-containing protein [Azospirillum sp.]|uniref:DUF7683 domain-containing protein n=1 Tax=Azospirillum sp. TaxID=34012 RepID=UPI003D70B043